MNVICPKCGAPHFVGEQLSKSTANNYMFVRFCLQCQVRLDPFPEAPPTLRNLLTGVSPQLYTFRDKIRRYNSAFAFTSTSAKFQDTVVRGAGPYSFHLQGMDLYHQMGALLPNDDDAGPARPSYAQLYIYNPDAALNVRTSRNPDCNPMIMTDLQAMLNDTHPYVPLYKHAYQIMSKLPPDQQATVQSRIVLQPTADRCRYNLPTANEIAAIIPGNGEEEVDKHREIIIRLKAPADGNRLKRISHLNSLYSPLHYILVFPNGEQGWHSQIPSLPGPQGQVQSKNVSQRRYYVYRLHPRPNEPETIFRGGHLFQQYVVDAWASIEGSELHWLRTHQKNIRADVYQGVRDAVDGQDHHPVNLGQQGTRIILPSSHPGSARHMYQLFQDSMAIARHCQTPDLFLTMTANPNWPEIQEALLELNGENDDPDRPSKCQTAADRPDIVVRVFHQKVKALLKDIRGGLFGKVAGLVYTIEFQKRGLPHIHILIFLHHLYKIFNADDVDKIVSAQLPDAVAHPMLHQTVTKCMLHGPCGPDFPNALCMIDGKCSKHFPKDFVEETRFGDDGYPEYARPNNGRIFTSTSGKTFNNSDVVTYCPLLSARYDCHINVEICTSIKAIKYIHKYIYKGHDLATMEVGGGQQQVDEIKDYVSGCYIGSMSSCWYIFEFPMHQKSPTVYCLPIHIEGQQLVYCNDDDDVEAVADHAENKDTRLMGWFKANQSIPEANNYVYQDFPQQFTWNAKTHKWNRCQRGFAIGRMNFVHPSAGERFYLRTLLTIIKGAKSWDDLKTVDGILHPTYKAACLTLSLLEDDGEWNVCLQEAGQMQTGGQLRLLIATILLHCLPAEPAVLWNNHKVKICDDLRARLINHHHIPEPTDDQVFDYGLYLINRLLLQSAKDLTHFPPMPLPEGDWNQHNGNDNYLLQEQLELDPYNLLLQVQHDRDLFNNEQQAAYDAIMHSINHKEGKTFFLHSAGGGGKNFVCNTVVSTVHSNEHVASSTVAAQILELGRTCHSRFKIPIPIH